MGLYSSPQQILIKHYSNPSEGRVRELKVSARLSADSFAGKVTAFQAGPFVTLCFFPPGPQTYGGTETRGAVNGPGLWRYDMALMKNTRLGERLNLQFRAEAFNIFNHTNFSTIGTSSLTSPTYGKVTNTRDPRIMQVALKLTF